MIQVFFNMNIDPTGSPSWNKVDSSSIIGLTQKCEPFGENFSLRLTPCRVFELSVLKSAFVGVAWQNLNGLYNVVIDEYTGANPETYVTHSDTYSYASLHVDSFDDTNETYYKWTLMDAMVLLNEELDWSELENPTVGDVVSFIANKYGITWVEGTTGSISPDLKIQPCPYVAGVSARDILGWIGELDFRQYHIACQNNTYPGRMGRLITYRWSNDPETSEIVSVDDCSSFKLGNKHTIERIVFDNGLIHCQYPVNASEDAETVYLDPNNILVSDEGMLQPFVNAIGTALVGTADSVFYDIDVEQCPIGTTIQTIRGGRAKAFTRGADTYRTFNSATYNYNGGWIGGIHFKTTTSKQEETQVINPIEKKLHSIDVTIDRQQGLLDIHGDNITEINNEMAEQSIHFQVDAQKSEVRVTNQSTYTPTAYTSFKGDGMRIYVDGEVVAEATATRFECDRGLGVQDWAIEQGSSANTLLFYRKG